MFDGFFLDGTSIPNSNDNINVEDGGIIDLPNATHGDIDDAMEVLDFIKLRYFQNLDR